ncbi:hypothetical protein ACFQ4C_21570 [Larkinella insperata]|uniref:Uncharacterized protein n=1 Tax=Larkinella insperata TaxID=332158 RepID=A0ABW3Q8N8_9BACT
MILIINGQHGATPWRNCICEVIDYTGAFDLLADFIANGLILYEATLLDAGKPMKLPVEAFDQHRFSPQLEKLQGQWQELLEQPVPENRLARQRMINWNRRLVGYYDRQLQLTLKAIGRVGKKLETLQVQGESGFKRSIHEAFTAQLRSMYIRTVSLEASRQQTVDRLKKLEA